MGGGQGSGGWGGGRGRDDQTSEIVGWFLSCQIFLVLSCSHIR